MMRELNPSAYPARHLAPYRGALVFTLLEASVGCGVLIVFGALLQAYAGSVGSNLAVVSRLLGFLWLIAWPAWRLRPVVHPRWWGRIALGLPRAIIAGVLLGLVGNMLFEALHAGSLARREEVWIVVWFLMLRTLAAGGAQVAHRARRRFRWQLIVSHVGIIVLMFIALTSAGSVVVLSIASHYISSNPVDMAASVRDELQLGHALSPLDPRRVDEVFRMIDAHRLPLRGESPLITFVMSPLVPSALGLVTRDGRVLGGRIVVGADGKQTRIASSWTDLVHLTPAQSRRLRGLVVHGQAGQTQIPGANAPESVAAVPIRIDGGANSMLVLRVTDFEPTQHQFFQALVAVFGLSTIALIVVAALPMLGLSFLFSYLMARELTGRLESLSGVTNSIASGNLDERVPITTHNEVGQLAEDVNRMADHLQTTMGELRAARAQSEEALRLRQELVANISHELRTPLATMRAQLETVAMRNSVAAGGASGPRAGDVLVPTSMIEALGTETERLEVLVEDLFALSRAQAGAIEMHIEPVDVAALVEEITGLMRPLAQQEGRIALSGEILHRPLVAMADPDRLQQILANLIRNAVRYTPDGGIIVVSAGREAGSILVSVTDTGEGIPAEHLPQIFDRFYRADPARSRATGGAGLGLAIVREFVELMGGHVDVESSVGEGASFHVFVPAAPK